MYEHFFLIKLLKPPHYSIHHCLAACLPKRQRTTADEEWRPSVVERRRPSALQSLTSVRAGCRAPPYRTIWCRVMCGARGRRAEWNMERQPGDEGQMENRQTERQRENLCLSVRFCLSVFISLYLSISPSVCLFISHAPISLALPLPHLRARSPGGTCAGTKTYDRLDVCK